MLIVYRLVWEITIFIIVFACMFFGMQRIDFAKIFKANSTLHIKIIIVFVSLAVAFGVAIGIGEIIELIGLLAK